MLNQRIGEITWIDRRREHDERDRQRQGTDEDRRGGRQRTCGEQNRTEGDDHIPGLLRQQGRAQAASRAPAGRNHSRLAAATRSSPVAGSASTAASSTTPAETRSMLSSAPTMRMRANAIFVSGLHRAKAVERTTGMSCPGSCTATSGRGENAHRDSHSSRSPALTCDSDPLVPACSALLRSPSSRTSAPMASRNA